MIPTHQNLSIFPYLSRQKLSHISPSLPSPLNSSLFLTWTMQQLHFYFKPPLIHSLYCIKSELLKNNNTITLLLKYLQWFTIALRIKSKLHIMIYKTLPYLSNLIMTFSPFLHYILIHTGLLLTPRTHQRFPASSPFQMLLPNLNHFLINYLPSSFSSAVIDYLRESPKPHYQESLVYFLMALIIFCNCSMYLSFHCLPKQNISSIETN